MAIIKIRNAAIDLDAAEIPNISASKITSGTMDAARIGSGTFADARIASSNVSQHATSFDDNKIVNDISTLAIRQASNENKGAYNTNSMYVDVFQDDTGIASNTNAPRNASEFVSSVYSDTVIPTITGVGTGTGSNNNSPTFSVNTSTGLITHDENSTVRDYSNDGTFGVRIDFGKTVTLNSGLVFNGLSHLADSGNGNYGITEFNASTGAGSGFLFGGSAITPTLYTNISGSSWVDMTHATGGTTGTTAFYNQTFDSGGQYNQNASPTLIKYTWTENSGTIDCRYIDLWTLRTWGILKTFKIFHNSSSTDPSSVTGDNVMLGITNSANNATGNFTGTTITAPSSVSEMGAIITYQDNAGTNTLNTDIILQLSADNGSNFTTATMTAMPDFASGIKMAKVNDLSVTAGTQLKYKISFANQSSGSKEARIRGVSLQY